jgi:hypothetical protein
MNAEKAVYALLSEAAAVTALAGSKIFPVLAPQDTDAPFIVYHRIDAARVYSIAGPSGLAFARVQVDAYALTYAAAKNLAAAVRQTLNGFRGTAGDVRVGGISLQTDQDILEDGTDPPLHRVSMDFMVTHDE